MRLLFSRDICFSNYSSKASIQSSNHCVSIFVFGKKQVVIRISHADYGSAQRLYVRLGYLPDGRGVTYNYQPTVAGQSYPLDDELILWLKKAL
jgi:hypothetical protein